MLLLNLLGGAFAADLAGAEWRNVNDNVMGGVSIGENRYLLSKLKQKLQKKLNKVFLSLLAMIKSMFYYNYINGLGGNLHI